MNAITFALFGLSALAALMGSLFTILAQNPIRSAMGLLLAIGGITGLFLGLNAQFLAAIELIVYAGAVVILFVFVIMLIGPDATPPTDSKAAFSRGLAAIVFSIFAVTTGILLVRAGDGPHAFPPSHIEHGTIEAFGRELFTKGLVPFELSSALLVVAVVGAVAVARGRHAAEVPAARSREERVGQVAHRTSCQFRRRRRDPARVLPARRRVTVRHRLGRLPAFAATSRAADEHRAHAQLVNLTLVAFNRMHPGRSRRPDLRVLRHRGRRGRSRGRASRSCLSLLPPDQEYGAHRRSRPAEELTPDGRPSKPVPADELHAARVVILGLPALGAFVNGVLRQAARQGGRALDGARRDRRRVLGSRSSPSSMLLHAPRARGPRARGDH